MEQERWKKSVRWLGNMEKIVAVISVVNFLWVMFQQVSVTSISDYLISGYVAIACWVILGVSIYLTGVYRDLYGAETDGDPVWDWALSRKRGVLAGIVLGVTLGTLLMTSALIEYTFVATIASLAEGLEYVISHGV